MLQIKERDQCIIHEEGILHNIRPRHGKAARLWRRQHCGRERQILVPSHKTRDFWAIDFIQIKHFLRMFNITESQKYVIVT